MDINSLAIDVPATIEGVWYYLDATQETGFLIARMGNKEFRKETAKVFGPHERSVKHNVMNDDLQEQLLAKVLTKTIVLSWKGITQGLDAKGEPKVFPYTKDNCESMLKEPKYQDLVKILMEFSSEGENYRLREIRDAGNESENESAGS